MKSISHKTKQLLLVIIKLLIVSGALYYIYLHLQGDKLLSLKSIVQYLSCKEVLILLLFTIANWFFEVLKWQNVVASFTLISCKEATQQTFGSLTASVFTPNRIGEYGAKVLYFKKESAKRIVVLNFIHNSSQMLVTLLFGLIGMLASGIYFHHKALNLLLAVIIIAFFFRNIEVYGFSIQKVIDSIRNFEKNILLKTFGFSALRYIVFSTQFLMLLLFFDIEIDTKTAFAYIFTMYFLASIIPSIPLMDVVIKGSVAVYLFGLLGVESWKIISITSLMWLFNLVLPIILGSYFVIRFKPEKK